MPPQARKSGAPVPTEPLPGRESEGWNNTTVNRYTSYRVSCHVLYRTISYQIVPCHPLSVTCFMVFIHGRNMYRQDSIVRCLRSNRSNAGCMIALFTINVDRLLYCRAVDQCDLQVKTLTPALFVRLFCFVCCVWFVLFCFLAALLRSRAP